MRPVHTRKTNAKKRKILLRISVLAVILSQVQRQLSQQRDLGHGQPQYWSDQPKKKGSLDRQAAPAGGGGGGGDYFGPLTAPEGLPAVVECRDESRGWHAPFWPAISSVYALAK